VSAAPPAVRRCAARRSDGPSRGRRATPAGRRRCGGGSGTPFPAARPPRHGNVAVYAPVRARGYGAGRRAWCRCVSERATALKARVLHAHAWNKQNQTPSGVAMAARTYHRLLYQLLGGLEGYYLMGISRQLHYCYIEMIVF